MYELKKEQQKAANEIHSVLFRNSKKATLASISTGWGKTILASKMIEYYTTKKSLKCLFVVDSCELLKQTGDKFKQASNLDYTIEQASNSADLESNVVLATRQSLAKDDRLQRFPIDHFQFIVIDEAHGAVCEEYEKIIKHFTGAKFLFLTATADKLVDEGLFNICDGGLGYEFTLRQSIKAGMNAPAKIKKLTIDNLEELSGKKDLVEALRPVIISKLKENILDKKTILFFPNVKTSKQYCEELKQAGLTTFHIDCNMKSYDKEATLKAFAKAGKGSVICNATLLGTGYDQPDIDCVCVLRNLQSRALYAQMVGRALRVHPGKEHGLILDLFNLSSKHNITASVKELEIMAKYKLQYELNGQGEFDLLEAENVEKMREDYELKLVKDLLKAQMEQVKESSQKNLKNVSSIVPFNICNNIERALKRNKIISQEQVKHLAKIGYSSAGLISQEAYHYIVNLHDEQKNLGRATLKQMLLLRASNMTFTKSSLLTKDQATKLIDSSLSRRGYRKYA